MKVLVVNPGASAADDDALRQAGHEVLYARQPGTGQSAPVSEDELLELCRQSHGIIASRVSGEVMASAPNLRAVVVPAIGYEKIDLESATNLGIVVCNSPTPENYLSVSEATIGLMMALLKRMKHKEAILRRGEWGAIADRGWLLWKKTVGLIGLGRVGKGVAERLAGWDVEILGYDPYVSADRAQTVGVTKVDLETLLRRSDIVSLHVIITPETRDMIGEEQLRLMKPTAYLINTARGESIVEEALTRAITEGRIAGAALDTFQEEPLPADSSLRELDPERVLLTPHNVAASFASLGANRALAIQSMVTALAGGVPETILNSEVVPAWKARFEGA